MGLFKKSTEELVELGIKHKKYSEYEKAEKCFLKAIDQGSAEAMYQMAEIMPYSTYRKWHNEKLAEKEAVELYKMAAELGHKWAMASYAQRLRHGWGTEKNAALALEWYKRAAESGAAYVCDDIGEMYVKGEGTAPDPKEAVRWLQKGAEAYSRLDHSCIRQIEPLDMDAAVRLYRKGVEKGNAECVKRLEELQKEGVISQQNDSDFIRILESRVKQGDTTAVERLARIYETGDGVPADRKKAMELYKKGFDLYGIRDLIIAPFRDGIWRLIETAGRAENDETRAWLKTVSIRGNDNETKQTTPHQEAYCLIGRMWEHGYAPRKDEYQAIKWYCRAGEHSDEEYMENEAFHKARRLLRAVVYFGGSDYARFEKERYFSDGRLEVVRDLSGCSFGGEKLRNGLHIVGSATRQEDFLKIVAEHPEVNAVITPERSDVRDLSSQLRKLRPQILVVSVRFPQVYLSMVEVITAADHLVVDWKKEKRGDLDRRVLKKIAALPAE